MFYQKIWQPCVEVLDGVSSSPRYVTRCKPFCPHRRNKNRALTSKNLSLTNASLFVSAAFTVAFYGVSVGSRIL
jgi:hypothetical protein